MLCGKQNEYGLNIEFYSLSHNIVGAEVHTDDCHQGYSGVLHGGFITSLLDAAMCHALFSIGVEAVTGDMQVKFLREIQCNIDIVIKGQVLESRGPIYKTKAWVESEGVTCATSSARFARRKV